MPLRKLHRAQLQRRCVRHYVVAASLVLVRQHGGLAGASDAVASWILVYGYDSLFRVLVGDKSERHCVSPLLCCMCYLAEL
jgi:hypothetical protein